MTRLTVLISFLAVTCSVYSKLPTNFQKCHMQKPNFNECLRAAVESGLKLLKKPIPELNMASLEPLTFNNIVFPNRHKKVLALHERLSYIEYHGFTKAKVSLFNINFDNTSIQAVFELESLLQKVNFTLSGNVLSEPLHYSGYIELKLDNNTFNIQATFEEIEKNGLTYAKIINSNLKLTALNTSIVKSLGDKQESEHLLKLFKNQPLAIFLDVKSDYERLFDEGFKKYANLVFSNVSMSELFGLAKQ